MNVDHMGSQSLKPNKITFDVPEVNQELYEKFNIIRIVRGLSKEEAFTELVRSEVGRSENILQTRWVRWDIFEKEMGEAGFPVNRVTLWKYKDMYANYMKTDGTDILLDIDNFLKIYRKEITPCYKIF